MPTNPWEELPRSEPSPPHGLSPLPPGRPRDAVLAMLGSAVGYTLLNFAGLQVGRAVVDDGASRTAYAIIEVFRLAAVLLGHATVGVFGLAGAVCASAALRGMEPRAVTAVARRLWPAVAGGLVLLNLGTIVILPGLVGALVLLYGADPVGRGESRGPGFRPPSGMVLPLTALAVVWGAAAVVWFLVEPRLMVTVRWPLAIGSRFAWELVVCGAYVVWCGIARRRHDAREVPA